MNYALHGTAQDVEPRREELLQRSEAIAVRPEATSAPTTSRARRLWISRIVAAWSRRPMMGSLPSPGPRQTAGSGVNPLSSGATRGIALMVRR
jgi:hypothetical protein